METPRCASDHRIIIEFHKQIHEKFEVNSNEKCGQLAGSWATWLWRVGNCGSWHWVS